MQGQKTKVVRIGNVSIGGANPVAVQSMLSCAPEDVEGNLRQTAELEAAGCEIIRVTVPNMQGVRLLHTIKQSTKMPVVADIHFDYRLGIESAAAGADKIRINPGNIGAPDRVKKLVEACRTADIPIRVGVNSGSLPKDILAQYGGVTPAGLAEAALRQAAMLEQFDFDNIVVAVKDSNVPQMVEACRIINRQCRYPQHIGVTHAGTPRMGIVKSAVGIGALLLQGIGDTLRVSLTADPVQEIITARDILLACGLQERAEVIACPTCGRCRIGVVELAEQVEKIVADCERPIKVAVMGCAVNGPGEAKQADIGIAGGDGQCLLFKKGEIIKKYPQEEILEVLRSEIEKL